MSYSALFFDLDDTVYANTNGLWQTLRQRIGLYMVERLGLTPDEVAELRPHYFQSYGTTLRGLQIHHQVDAEDYLAYVHDVPLEQYIQPAPALKALLGSLPLPRWIFTNADANHAQRVLTRLGIQDCFTGIIDIHALDFFCKPNPEAYTRALAQAGNPDPAACVMLDDSLLNLAPARALGFTTVLVGPAVEPHPAASRIIPSLLDLPRALPELWPGEPGGPALREARAAQPRVAPDAA